SLLLLDYFFFSASPRPPPSSTLFPYTTLFRSLPGPVCPRGPRAPSVSGRRTGCRPAVLSRERDGLCSTILRRPPGSLNEHRRQWPRRENSLPARRGRFSTRQVTARGLVYHKARGLPPSERRGRDRQVNFAKS